MNTLGRFLVLTALSFSLGTLLALSLFKFNITAFRRSELSKKTLFWLPILAVFLVFIYSPTMLKIIIFILVLATVSREQLELLTSNARHQLLIIVYLVFITLGLYLVLLYSLVEEGPFLVLLLGFSTALSDVCAFFFGRFLGSHKLPEWINKNKSWEGVYGEIVGAVLALLLVNLFFYPKTINLELSVPVGVGAAWGDLSNSFIKRRLGVKNWSGLLPGHGGFTDRLSSLVGSSILVYFFLH